jgi:ABC-type Na+ efflux pump permease subunit
MPSRGSSAPVSAIVGEVERGTLPLLLSYPVRRWQVILGKFLGHILILFFATTLGYSAAAGALARFSSLMMRAISGTSRDTGCSYVKYKRFARFSTFWGHI